MLKGEYTDARMSATIRMDGRGKGGLVFRLDEDGNGYYISLDLVKGLAQARGWGENPAVPGPHSPPDEMPPEQGFVFDAIQSGNFISKREGPWDIQLVGYGRYIELSINGYIVLTFANDRYTHGRMGFYVEGARMRIDHVTVDRLRTSKGDDMPVALVGGPGPNAAASGAPGRAGLSDGHPQRPATPMSTGDVNDGSPS